MISTLLLFVMLAKPTVAPAAPPPQVTGMLACRQISDGAARLACFDRAAEGLEQAITRRDVVVVDREAVRSTRRSLFGFAVPNLGLFGGSEKEDIKQLDGVVASTSGNRDGGYVLTLRDGSSWSQLDDRPLAVAPRAGDKVLVTRASLGSYMLSVSRQPGIRVRRIN